MFRIEGIIHARRRDRIEAARPDILEAIVAVAIGNSFPWSALAQLDSHTLHRLPVCSCNPTAHARLRCRRYGINGCQGIDASVAEGIIWDLGRRRSTASLSWSWQC